MKLIEIDDNSNNLIANNSSCIDDENYSKPRVLSILDSIMNKILTTPSISDVDKWKLYSQALHRYLNYVKITSQKNDYNSSCPEKDNNRISTEDDTFRNPCNSSFNFSLPQSEMSGVEPIRDSLDSILPPIARVARDHPFMIKEKSLSPQNKDLLVREPERKTRKSRNRSHSQPYEVRPHLPGGKRRAENSLSHETSSFRPRKIALNINKIRWEPTKAT